MIEGLRCRIVIQQTHTGTDAVGNHKAVWEDYYKCYAYANNLSGAEFFAAKQIGAEVEVDFIIRYCKKVSTLKSDKFRIIFNGEIYNITFVDNVQYKNKTLKLRAKREA